MQVVVVGGGTMGVGIAHRVAARGGSVELVDIDLDTARRSVERVAQSLRTAHQRGKLDDSSAAISRVTPVGSIADATANPDVVIEAVIENPDLKRSILADAEMLDPLVLGSNTSSISIDELASGLDRKDRFAGLHFFNPVWAISLVEVVRGADTSELTLSRISDFVDFLGMEQALINDSPGFATTRLGVLAGLEAVRMVEQGVALPADIDRAMSLGYRHPMGPLMLGDLVGHDVRLGIATHLASVYGERFEPPELLRRMVAEGRLGKKTGVGFYDWSSGSPEPIDEN